MPEAPRSKQQQLEALADDFVSAGVTSELAVGAQKLVMGEGNANADIIFIGEAPGAKEDELGRPFVGAAGKFLDEMLASIELNRSEVFITSIIKYRPPKNRDPKPIEIEESKPYLIKQIEIIEPKLIVFLGRHSMNVFLPELRISEAHGQSYERDGQLYMPLYHPAAALYNGSMRQTLLEDFAKISNILEKIDQEK